MKRTDLVVGQECMVTDCPNPATRLIWSAFLEWPGWKALCDGHGSRPEPARKTVPLSVEG
jgi:hypothetical protein